MTPRRPRPLPRWSQPAQAREAGNDTGSLTLELAVLAPALLALISVLVLGARIRLAEASVELAAGQAARAASLARSATDARREALASARAVLDREGLDCLEAEVDVDTTGFLRAPGSPATVSVDVTCRARFSDIGLPGLPGIREFRSDAVSPLDTYRERS